MNKNSLPFLSAALFIAFCFVSTINSSAQGPAGLRGYYKFDGNGGDSSGNGFTVSLNQTPVFGDDRFGRPNSALSVHSESDVALIPIGGFANFLSGTVSLWVKTTENRNTGYYWADPSLFGSDLSGFTDSAFGIYTEGGKIGLWGQLHTYNHDDVYLSTKRIDDNQWHFVFVKINDNGVCKLYVDAVYVGSLPAGSPLSARVYAIMGKGGGACYHNGLVDDVRVYDHVLSDCDMLSLYNSSSFSDNSINLGADLNVCNNSRIIFTPTINNCLAPQSYTWVATGDPLSCTSCQNPSVTITQNSSYVLTVKYSDSTSASDTVSYTVSGIPNTLLLSLSNSNLGCSQTADVTQASVTGAVLPINYSWGDGNNQIGIDSQIHNYTAEGIYIISIMDSATCITSTFDTIVNSGLTVSLSREVKPTCIGDSTGMIKIVVSGGQAPYTYEWKNNLGSLDSVINLTTGNYAVIVTDTNSCSALFYHTLSSTSDKWAYFANIAVTNANCSNNGSIVTLATGGLPPYNYQWNTGDSVPNLQNIGGGRYYVTVTDAEGCSRKANGKVLYDCANVINGQLFIDVNNNCIVDSGEVVQQYAIVAAYADGIYYYNTVDRYGKYSILVPDTGTYYMGAYIGESVCANFSLCGNNTGTIHFSTLGDTLFNNNFAIAPSTGFDLTMHPGWTTANPGFEKEYWIMPFNQSYEPFNGTATVTFTYDSNLVYLASDTPNPVHDPIAHTLTWTITQSLPSPDWDWYNTRFKCFFHVPVTLDLGQELYNSFDISPTTADCDSSNNHIAITETVRGSHDPNEKSSVPAQFTEPSDSVITYTIHFQNTGNDSTHFIKVADTLSSYLDPATVKNIASSHPYSEFTVSAKGALLWAFNPLHLVDSITNPAGSQGFVTFSVKKKKGLSMGTMIKNTAHIYFDYYDAVVTNTVVNTVGSRTSGISEVQNEVSVKAFPNPFDNSTHIVIAGLKEKYDFELFDVTGRLKRRIASSGNQQFELLRGDLSAGVYFYRISVTGKQAAYGKLVVQ